MTCVNLAPNISGYGITSANGAVIPYQTATDTSRFRGVTDNVALEHDVACFYTEGVEEIDTTSADGRIP